MDTSWGVFFCLLLSPFILTVNADTANVTFYPSTKAITSVSKAILDTLVNDPQALLQGSCPESALRNKEIFQASFSESSLPQTAIRLQASASGFVGAAVEAYNNHHHLVLRPDDLWITILSQLNLYVNAHADELRHMFVKFEGKKELGVNMVGSRYTVDLPRMLEKVGNLMQKNVLDPGLREWIVPDFSTTTTNDRIVSSVMMMAYLKSFVEYHSRLLCGLPAVTLLGKPNSVTTT